jgi:hypothetical protein
MLVTCLLQDYGLEHAIIHYIASQYSIIAPIIERYEIKDFEDPEVAKRVTGMSTFYLPHKDNATKYHPILLQICV